MSEEGTSSPSSSFGSDTIIDSEIDFTKTGFDVGITDSDLFKYFLSDDIVGTNHELLTTITSHTFEASDSPNQSPQPSPQLSPEVNEFGLLTDSSPTQISVFDTNIEEVPLIPIKQEGTPTIITPTKKPSRKRERPAKDTTPAVTREDLNKLNRSGDANNSIIISNKQLSVDEEKQLKRQKRLIKNRESAQLSRLRKKIYIEELERKVTTLTTETENLSKQVNQLQVDKKKLQGEVVYLQNIIKQSPELSITLSKRNSPTTIIPAKNMKAAGVCLLIVLFSVGLLFNSKDPNNKLIFKTGATTSPSTSGTNSEDIPQIVTTKTTRSVYTGRVLKSIDDNNKFTLSKEDSDSNKIIPSISELPPVKTETSSSIVPPQYNKKHDIHSISLNEEEDEEQKEVIRIEDNRITLEATSNKVINDRRKRMKIEHDSSSDDSMSLVPATTSTSTTTTTTTIPTSDVILQRNPSASYIYCPEAHHIAPSITNSGASEMIALLIPASVLNSTLTGNNTLDTSLLEISCSILNLHMWPLNNRATN